MWSNRFTPPATGPKPFAAEICPGAIGVGSASLRRRRRLGEEPLAGSGPLA